MSGVYIQGMKMPTNEPLIIKINPDGSVSTTWKNDYKKYEAIPVPPHGKVIDVDALIEQIEFEIRHYVVKDEFDKGRVVGWKNIIRAIREYTPTIIPASKEGE